MPWDAVLWQLTKPCSVIIFSRDEAILYEGVSVGPSDGPSDGNQFFFRPTRSDICRVYGLVNRDEATPYEWVGPFVGPSVGPSIE